MEVPRARPLPAGIPRRLARRPHMAAALLRWRNAYHLRRVRVLSGAALALALALGVLAAPPTGPVLQWLAASPVITFAISAGLFGLAAIRRQARIQIDGASSWLSALPVASSPLLRLVWGTCAWLLAAVAFVGLAWAAGRVTTAMASVLV